MASDVGIVIVNYNTRELLRRCLASVLDSEGVKLNVCVVDNASRDGSAAMVAAEYPQVELIANDDNVGYPAANNQGLMFLGFGPQPSDVAPRYALLLNADTEVPADGIQKTVQFADDHPKAAVVGPRLVRPDGSLDLACRRSFPTPGVSACRLLGLSRLFPRSRLFGRYNLTYLSEHETADVDSVVGAYMLVRREAIEQVGLLDEAFFMYGEDLDWAYRMKAAGWRVYYYRGNRSARQAGVEQTEPTGAGRALALDGGILPQTLCGGDISLAPHAYPCSTPIPDSSDGMASERAGLRADQVTRRFVSGAHRHRCADGASACSSLLAAKGGSHP